MLKALSKKTQDEMDAVVSGLKCDIRSDGNTVGEVGALMSERDDLETCPQLYMK